jgi:hypothetical protein
MKWILAGTVAALALNLAATETLAQQSAFPRLSPEVLDVTPPSARVSGTPGELTIQSRACRDVPGTAPRRRIVDIAIQEWAFFGFPVLDRTTGNRFLPPAMAPSAGDGSGRGYASTRRGSTSPAEAARVATSIAGYWAATPDGAWVVTDQNRAWSGPRGIGARWVAPWSAAFISWVMCEAGLGEADRFRRGVAHWVYIDQAIRARDGRSAESAYIAYDIGEQPVEPGDMLCTSRRPEYRNLAERRRQLGQGARSHCDIVVTVDERTQRILAIGGNVLRSVSLKVLPGGRGPEGDVRPRVAPGVPLFAHLKLRGDPIELDALLHSPTLAGQICLDEVQPLTRPAFLISAIGLGPAAYEQCRGPLSH